MKSEKLLYAIGLIDESIIEEAIPKLSVKRPVKKFDRLKKLATVAACATIILFITFALLRINKIPINNNPGVNNFIAPEQQTDRSETDTLYFFEHGRIE